MAWYIVIPPKTDELKVHIWHLLLREFKNNKNAKETAKKICSVHDQSVKTDHPIKNWFSKFYSGDINELKPWRTSELDQDVLRKLLEYNL